MTNDTLIVPIFEAIASKASTISDDLINNEKQIENESDA